MSDKEQSAKSIQALPAFSGIPGSSGRHKGMKNLYAAKIPNKTSLEAIEQARTGKGLVGPFNSFEELWADLNADD